MAGHEVRSVAHRADYGCLHSDTWSPGQRSTVISEPESRPRTHVKCSAPGFEGRANMAILISHHSGLLAGSVCDTATTYHFASVDRTKKPSLGAGGDTMSEE